MFDILIYTTFHLWFSILRHCLCKHKNHIVPFIMSLYLSYVKTKYFLLFDKDPEKFEDTKGAIRIHKSKNRQHNDKKIPKR